MSDSALKQQLTEAMKDAMRAKDKARLGTIRLALSEIKRVEVDERWSSSGASPFACSRMRVAPNLLIRKNSK
jgi:uncharacterized protein YqeY